MLIELNRALLAAPPITEILSTGIFVLILLIFAVPSLVLISLLIYPQWPEKFLRSIQSLFYIVKKRIGVFHRGFAERTAPPQKQERSQHGMAISGKKPRSLQRPALENAPSERRGSKSSNLPRRKFSFLPEAILSRRDYNRLERILEDTGFAYDPGQDIFYSTMYAWQRKYGYCRLYDEATAPWSMIIDCEPVHFEYAGKRWLIEFWKGQYGMTTGCEIGVFTTTNADVHIPGVFDDTFYDSASDADRLQLSAVLRKKGRVCFARKGLHWWLTGFMLGEFSEPSQLTVDLSITLKDAEMCTQFVGGLEAIGYTRDEFHIKGNTVSLRYDHPHSPQPMTRTPATDWITQRKNEALCKAYKAATAGCDNIFEQLKIMEKHEPAMIAELRNLRRSRQLVDLYRSISAHAHR